MNIAEFVDHNSDSDPGFSFETAGPMSLRLLSEVANEGRTRSMLATNFWQAFLRSTAWFAAAERLALTPGALERSRALVVPRPQLTRFDLLLLDPMLPVSAPRYLRVEPDEDSLVEGWFAWANGVARRWWLGRVFTPNMITELVSIRQPFAIVAARAPETELLSVPRTPVEIDATPIVSSMSTAGIVAHDKAGRWGVTAALHGVQNATNVLVDSHTGTVLVRDTISDSCFIEVATLPTVGSKGSKGVMSQMAPRGNQTAEFDGVTSITTGSPTPTTVLTWDVDVPHIAPHRQLRVYTPRDAQPGDSGAALITDDDYVIAFAFERTKPNSQPEHCSWIWADSVVQALGLEL